MKQFLFIIVIFVFSVVDAMCQDYYSGNTRIRGEILEYIIHHKDYQSFQVIDLDNVDNVLSNQNPYDTVAKQYYSEALHPMPHAQPNYDSLDAIVASIFSDDDKARYFSKDCRLMVTFRVDPHTRHAKEMNFGLYYDSDNNQILSLPISKIEQLEIALKKDLLFYVHERGKDADFLILSGRIL